MYNATKVSKQELIKERDEDLDILDPSHGDCIAEGDKDYYEYLERLWKETDIRKTKRAINAKFNKPMTWKEALKRFGAKGFVLVFLTGALGLTTVQILYRGNVSQEKRVELNKKANIDVLALFSVLGFLSGTILGGYLFKSSLRQSRESAVEDMYARLTLNLFNYAKTTNIELDKNMLKKYNPALAELVVTLLMANMDKADTEKLRAIAIDLQDKIASPLFGIEKYHAVLDEAMGIIKKALETNTELLNRIILAYKGCATSTIYIDNRMTNLIFIANSKQEQQ